METFSCMYASMDVMYRSQYSLVKNDAVLLKNNSEILQSVCVNLNKVSIDRSRDYITIIRLKRAILGGALHWIFIINVK